MRVDDLGIRGWLNVRIGPHAYDAITAHEHTDSRCNAEVARIEQARVADDEVAFRNMRKLMCETYSESPRLIPETAMTAFTRPEKTLPRIPEGRNGHEKNWLDAIRTQFEIEHALVNIGFDTSLGPIKEWGLEVQDNAIKVDSMMHTSRPGIFAAGDICTYPGKLKLIATGFGEACTSINFAKVWLDPGANAFPGHSSNMK